MLVDNDKLKQAKEAIANQTPDLIAELLNLEQYDSRNHKALCPYHLEDTPSFVWDAKRLRYKCFAKETRIITKYGVKQIGDVINVPVEIINGNGQWEEVIFKNLGKQQLMKITLTKRNKNKIIYATDNHEWIIQTRKNKIPTIKLKKGMALERMWFKNTEHIVPSIEGMKHGFIYGDGSSYKTKERYQYKNQANVFIDYKYEFCKKIMPENIKPVLPSTINAKCRIYFRSDSCLKKVPNIEKCTKEYLYGFLIGYFVADGNCTDESSVQLHSANYNDLIKIRDIFTYVGIPTYPIGTTIRKTEKSNMGALKNPNNRTEYPLYCLRIVHSCIPDNFFITTKKPTKKPNYKSYLGWRVNSVEYTDRYEDVYCCETSTHSFVLEDFILTGNCFGCNRTADIVDAYVETGLTFLEACEKVFELAGMSYSFGERGVKIQNQYRYPHEEEINDKDKIIKYFDKRCISKETLDYCDIREDKYGNIVFNYYDTNDVLTMVKYKPSHKIDKSKKEIKSWCQKDADTTPLLFNMNKVNAAQPLLITEGECFKGDTQILTPSGWVKLKDYKGQYVLQVNNDLTAEFVNPISYVKKNYNGKMFDITKGGNFSLTTTIEHNWVYKDLNGNIKKIKPSSLPKYFYYGNIPTSVNHSEEGLILSNDEIALWIAISADGTIDLRNNLNYNYCRISLKKQRKIDRFVSLLTKLNIDYTTSVNNRDEHFFGFKIPKYITKELPIEFATCTSLERKQFIISEIVNWDGNKVPNRNQIEYSTTIEHNAEVIQTIAHLCGYRSTIIYRHSKSKDGTKEYKWIKVSILFGGSRQIAFNNNGISTFDYKGMVYCVSVPSGMILVRQNEHITVCGNCDCLAAIESGYKNAVSVPLGANNYGWIEHNWEFLEQFDSIILAMDNDEAGIKAQKEIIYRLGTWRTSIMNLPDVIEYQGKERKCKDVNELLFYCGKNAVLDAIVHSKDMPVQSVVDFSTVEDIDMDSMDGIYTGFKALDKVIGKIFYSMVTVVSGLPSSGKSSFLNQIIANTIDNGEKVWIFSKEMNANILSNWLSIGIAGKGNLKEYMNSYTGEPFYKIPLEVKEKIRKFYEGQLFLYKDDAPNDEDSLFQSMEECVRKFGTRTLIIDNLMCIALKNNNDKYDAQTDFFNRLTGFAKKFNVAIIIVCHPRKLQSGVREVDMYDISGSANIVNLAHLSFALRRITKKEKEDPKCPLGKYNVCLTILKDRIQGRNDIDIPFFYDVPSRRFFTTFEEYKRDYKWDTEKTNKDLELPECLQDGADILYGKGE